VLFLYRHLLGREIGEVNALIRARWRRKAPVVLTPEEVKAVLVHTKGVERLVMTLLYGAGLRVNEGLRLRAKDVDFFCDQITVRDSKGEKDRMTMLPASLKPFLAAAKRLRDRLCRVASYRAWCRMPVTDDEECS
jgi:integrase